MAIFLKILLKQIPVVFVILTSLNGVLLTPNQHSNVTNNFHQNPNLTNDNSNKQLNATNAVRQNYNVIQLFSAAKPYQKSNVADNSNVRNNVTSVENQFPLNATLSNVQQNHSATNNVSQHLSTPNGSQNPINFQHFSNVTNNVIHPANVTNNVNYPTNLNNPSNVTNNVIHPANVTNNVNYPTNLILPSNVTNNVIHRANVTNNVVHLTNVTNNVIHPANVTNKVIHHANVTNNVAAHHFQTENVAGNVTQHLNNVSQNLNARNDIIKNNAQRISLTNNVTQPENNAHQLVNVGNNVTDRAHHNVTDRAHHNVSNIESVLDNVNRGLKMSENVNVTTAAGENVTKDLTNISTAVDNNNNRKSKHVEDNFPQNLSANKHVSPATLLNASSLNDTNFGRLPEISTNQSSPFVETTPTGVLKQETVTITTPKSSGMTSSTAKPRKSGRPSLIQRLMMNSRTVAPGSRAATPPEVIYDDGPMQMFDIGEAPAIPTTTKVAMPSFYEATPPAWLLQQMVASTGASGVGPKLFEITIPALEADSAGVAAGNNEELVESASENSHHGIPVEATNSIIISGIICGCAIVFFSILMALCIWRQNKSRRPIYPPNSTMLPTTSLTSINSQKPN